MKKIKDFVLQTLKCWWNDEPLSEGAALSFYTIIAFPALTLSLLFITGIFLEKETLQAEILRQSNIFFGFQGKNLVEQILNNVPAQGQLHIASIISIFILLFGAMGFFQQLQKALNKIWNVAPKKNIGWGEFFKNKAITFLMVIGFGGLVIGTMLLEFIISFLLPSFQSAISIPVDLVQTVGLIISFFIMIVVFGFIYKYLPYVKIAWHDVWVGATITAILFTLGKYLIGFYLAHNTLGNSYGAAGSLVIFLIWVYYSSQAIFLGAEFTQNYANIYGLKIRPRADALRTNSWWNKVFRKV